MDDLGNGTYGYNTTSSVGLITKIKMTTKTLDFKCAVITGGAGGIGKALAIDLLARGKKVILAGRTESSLQKTSSEIGASAHYVLDVGKTATIAPFVAQLLKDHPEVDCLINNAGVQRPFEFFGKEYTFDLAKADEEIDINVRGPMHLTLALLPHLAEKGRGVVMNVSSVLGFVPFSTINPVYNGTKAWLHSWSTNLRTQLEAQGKNIKVVEIVPPAVESDLHRDRTDPDDNKQRKGATALPMEQFMDDVRAGWEADLDTVSAGPGKEVVKEWDESMGARYRKVLHK